MKEFDIDIPMVIEQAVNGERAMTSTRDCYMGAE